MTRTEALTVLDGVIRGMRCDCGQCGGNVTWIVGPGCGKQQLMAVRDLVRRELSWLGSLERVAHHHEAAIASCQPCRDELTLSPETRRSGVARRG